MIADMNEMQDSNRGRRPIRSMRNQGMKEATKNHVWRKPDINADKWSENPRLAENKVLE